MRNFILACGLLCVVVGCGPGGNVITGKVSLDDGSPAPRGMVMIRNESGSFRGGIQSDGTYTIEGAAAGEYQVVISGVTDSAPGDDDTSMEYNDETGEYTNDVVAAPKSLIDLKYANPQMSGLTMTIPGGNYDFTVDRAEGVEAAPPADDTPAEETPAEETPAE